MRRGRDLELAYQYIETADCRYFKERKGQNVDYLDTTDYSHQLNCDVLKKPGGVSPGC